MTLRIFGDPVFFQIGPVPVTETMVTSLGVTLLLVVVAVAMRVTVGRRPPLAGHACSGDGRMARRACDGHCRPTTPDGSDPVRKSVCVYCRLQHRRTIARDTPSHRKFGHNVRVSDGGVFGCPHRGTTPGFWGYVKHYASPTSCHCT